MAKDVLNSDTLTKDEKEVLETIFQSLTNSCETAYRNGIDSAEIYKTLQFHIKENEKLQNSTNSSSKLLVRDRVLGCLEFLRKVFWIFVISSFTIIGIYWSVCDYLNVNPLNVIPSAFLLQEKRCLVPSNPLIMEMTRPIPNCSFCMPIGKVKCQLSKY